MKGKDCHMKVKIRKGLMGVESDFFDLVVELER